MDPPGSERQRVHALNPRNRLIMPGVNRLLPVVRPTAPVLLLCGYYGEHNLGDDALLQVLVSSLPEPQQLLITARDPAPVLALAPSAQTVNRRSLRLCLRAALRADVLVLGGGSLLQDSTSWRSLLYYAALILSARLQGKPVILWAQGLGPLRRRRSRALASRLLSLVSAASWRDRQSAALAQRLASSCESKIHVYQRRSPDAFESSDGARLRGVISAGACGELFENGYSDCFDAAYGSSAGAMNLTYYLANQLEGIRAYEEDLCDGAFLDLSRHVSRRMTVIREAHIDLVRPLVRLGRRSRGVFPWIQRARTIETATMEDVGTLAETMAEAEDEEDAK